MRLITLLFQPTSLDRCNLVNRLPTLLMFEPAQNLAYSSISIFKDQGTAMGEIINLNKVRKAKARASAEASAAQNRSVFGLTRRSRDEAERQATLAKQKLDAKQLDD